MEAWLRELRLLAVLCLSLPASSAMAQEAAELCPSPVDTYGEVGPSWAPDGRTIAFVSSLCGTRQIFRIRSDGSGLERLTHRDGGFDTEPSWSPDGHHIAFVSDRGGTLSLHLMDPDGTNVERITDDGGNDFGHVAWSPDGRRLLFASDRARPGVAANPLDDGRIQVEADSTELFLLDLGRGSLRRVTDNVGPDFMHQGAWLDDDHVAITGASPNGKDIYVLNLASGASTRLTTDGVSDYPTLSPDRTTLLFLTRRDGDGTEIYGMSPEGGEQRRLTFMPGYDQGAAWSPDGRLIVFSSQRSGATRLYLMRPDGGGVRRLTPTFRRIRAPGTEATAPRSAPTLVTAAPSTANCRTTRSGDAPTARRSRWQRLGHHRASSCQVTRVLRRDLPDEPVQAGRGLRAQSANLFDRPLGVCVLPHRLHITLRRPRAGRVEERGVRRALDQRPVPDWRPSQVEKHPSESLPCFDELTLATLFDPPHRVGIDDLVHVPS